MFTMDVAGEQRIKMLAQQVRDKVVETVAADARRYAPVDTGYLRDHITADIGRGWVVAEADYAAVQELGYPPHNLRAQPYLRPALYKNRVIDL